MLPVCAGDDVLKDIHADADLVGHVGSRSARNTHLGDNDAVDGSRGLIGAV